MSLVVICCVTGDIGLRLAICEKEGQGLQVSKWEVKEVRGELFTDIRWSWDWGESRVEDPEAEGAVKVVCLVMLRFHIDRFSDKGRVDKVSEGNECWKWVFVHVRMFIIPLYSLFLSFFPHTVSSKSSNILFVFEIDA